MTVADQQNWDYGTTKLGGAVDTLATHAGRISERLASAWSDIHPVSDENLRTEEQRRLWAAIRKSIGAAKPPSLPEDGPLGGMVRMAEGDAIRIAEQILELYEKIRGRGAG